MKILLHNGFDSPVGGVETYFHTLCSELQSQGHNIVRLYTRSGRKLSIRDGNCVTYYLPDIGRWNFFDIAQGLKSKSIQRDLKRLRHILDKEKPDIIHLQNCKFPFFFKLVKGDIPIIQSVQDYNYTCPGLLKLLPKSNDICTSSMGTACFIKNKCIPITSPRWIHRFGVSYINRQICSEFTKLLVASESMKKALLLNGFAKSKIVVLPLFTELETGKVDENSYNSKIILYSGQTNKVKGISLLLKALSYIKEDFHLIIDGKGLVLDLIKRQVKEMQLEGKVTFCYSKSREEINRNYKTCSMVIVPSIWPEPFGLVGLEAMAHSKPVIAFDVGGIPEWLCDQKTGYLVPRGDTKKLAEKISLLLKNPDTARQLGQEGRKRVMAKFNKQTHISSLLKIYQDVIAVKNTEK